MSTTALPGDITRRLEKYSNLPSIPQIILQIKQVSENPKSSASDLANCILTDHQLTSRILRMANSAYYGDFSGKITTVTRAIILMGFRAVRNIAISMAAYQMVNNLSKHSSFDITSFWTRSLACGVIAKYLACHTNHQDLVETSFIAGFLHDIGQALLAGSFPEKYEEIIKIDSTSADIQSAERVLLGIDHLEAGAFIAKKWNLPTSLVKAISEHHRIGKEIDEKSDTMLVDLVYLGDILYAHLLKNTAPDSPIYQELIARTQRLISISDEDMVQLLTVCRAEISSIARDLEIDITETFDRGGYSDEDISEMRRLLSNKEVQLAFLQNASDALMASESDDEILQVVCEAIFRGQQMGRVIVFEYSPRWQTYIGRVGFGMDSQKDIHSMSFSVSGGIFGHVRETKDALSVLNDDGNLYGPLVTREERRRLDAKSFAVIPIAVIGEVKFIVFVDHHDKEMAIDDSSLKSMEALTRQASMMLERNLFKAQIQVDK